MIKELFKKIFCKEEEVPEVDEQSVGSEASESNNGGRKSIEVKILKEVRITVDNTGGPPNIAWSGFVTDIEAVALLNIAINAINRNMIEGTQIKRPNPAGFLNLDKVIGRRH